MASTVAAPLPMAASRHRAAYTKVQVTGLALMAASPLLVLVVSLATGMTDDLVFFVVPILVLAVGAALAWRFGMVGKIAGLVIALLGAAAGSFLAMGLTVPGSIGDFAPAAMMAAGTLLALGGGIAAIRAQAKHHMEDAPSERRIITVALAVVALAMGISAVLSFTGRSTVDAAAAEGAARANMSNFEFAESTYEVAAGGGSILVHNGDAFVHDFAVPALGIEAQTVMPGSEALIEISGAEAGEYRIFCTLHSDQNAATVEDAGMAATLLVK